MVTGTSVLGLTFEGGVMLAADTLGSYGSLARFRSVSRVRKVTDNCAVAASGDYADFQFMERLFQSLTYVFRVSSSEFSECPLQRIPSV